MWAFEKEFNLAMTFERNFERVSYVRYCRSCDLRDAWLSHQPKLRKWNHQCFRVRWWCIGKMGYMEMGLRENCLEPVFANMAPSTKWALSLPMSEICRWEKKKSSCNIAFNTFGVCIVYRPEPYYCSSYHQWRYERVNWCHYFREELFAWGAKCTLSLASCLGDQLIHHVR